MKLYVDIDGVQFTVTKAPEPKTDQGGVQRTERDSKLPMWVTQVMALDETGAEVIVVGTVASERPKLTVGQSVIPVSLEAMPWMVIDNKNKAKNGVSFRAKELRLVAAPGGKAASSSS